MKLHFFTISARFPEDAQNALNVFCMQHRVLNIEKQFVSLGHDSYWSVCVTIMDKEKQDNGTIAGNKREAIDYKEVLGEQDFAIYVQLRNLRKTLSEKEGIPAYALFTNAQLARMVTQQVDSIAALGKIEGIDKSRLEKYGHSFLKTLQAARMSSSEQVIHSATHET